MADAHTQNNLDPLYQPYYEGLSASQIRFPRCSACMRFHWYPLPRCPHCRHAKIDWVSVNGPATVFTWTIVQHAFDKAFYLKPPYVVALLEFDDAPSVRLVANLDGLAEQELRIGMSVRPIFSSVDGHPRVIFKPA